MGQLIAPWLVGWGLLLVVATGLWVVSLSRDDVSLVDVAWGPFFLVLALVDRLLGPQPATPRQLVLLALVAIWALRLAVHIARRQRGGGEDRRYREMRERHGESFRRRSLATVFWLQATLAALLSLPFLLVEGAADTGPWGAWQTLGLGLWVVGFAWEAVADAQLARFQRRPDSGQAVLDTGLWRFSRHPNYFGEALLWWGYAAWAVPFPHGPWALVAAAAMTFLLLRVSGIPLLEAGIESRRPGYAEYARRTSAFVPWPPRRTEGVG